MLCQTLAEEFSPPLLKHRMAILQACTDGDVGCVKAKHAEHNVAMFGILVNGEQQTNSMMKKYTL